MRTGYSKGQSKNKYLRHALDETGTKKEPLWAPWWLRLL